MNSITAHVGFHDDYSRILCLNGAAILAIVTLLFATEEANNPPASAVEIEVIEQEVNERTLSDWSLQQISFDRPPSIGDIEQLRIFGGKIFVYDVAYMNVKRYSLSGHLEAVYGEGRGQGPGEFQNIFSFWVSGKEAVWVVDSRARTVSRFQYDGNFVDSFHPPFAPMRVATLERDQLVLQMFGQPNLFALVNEEGEVLRRFGKMVTEDQEVHTGLFDAHMFPRPTGGFIWAPINASYLFFYNENAVLERRMELIDAHKFPFERMASNPMQDASDAVEQPHRTMAVSVTGENIFVNTLIRDEDTVFNVLDRYNRATGKYSDSVRIPFGGDQYQVHNGVIYGGAADTSLRAFHFRIPR